MTTRVVPTLGADVFRCTVADIRVAVQRSLDRLGVTYEELARQARDDDFDSVQARVAWVAIGDLPEWILKGTE